MDKFSFITNLILTGILVAAVVMAFKKFGKAPANTPYFMTVAAFLVRSYYLTYNALAFLALLTPPLLVLILLFSAETVLDYGYTLLMMFFYISATWWLSERLEAYLQNRQPDSHHNFSRRYTGNLAFLNKTTDRFIAWMGKLKYFQSPVSIVYDPKSYKVSGQDLRQLIQPAPDTDQEEKIFHLQPGDILLRGYDGYIDGELIRLTGGEPSAAQKFTHAALYIGEVSDDKFRNRENDRNIAGRRLQFLDTDNKWKSALEHKPELIEEMLNQDTYYQTGKQMVLHSMSRGVHLEDILTFARCDYLAVLRLKDQDIASSEQLVECINQSESTNIATKAYHERHFFDDHLAGKFIDQLKNGETLKRRDVINELVDTAMGKLGSCYDFQFSDTDNAHTFSCSEFVYYCYRSLTCYLGLKPVNHAFKKHYFPRETVTPEDLFHLINKTDRLELKWMNNRLKKEYPEYAEKITD